MNFKNETIKVAGGALFSALSIVFSILFAPIIPRLGWGIAIIDPVSIIWILSFLVFGFTAGITCTLVGFISLFLVDPFVPWGPLFKLAATLPLIVIPYALVKISSKNGQDTAFKSLKKYLVFTIPSVIVRCVLMLAANLLFFIFIMPYAINQFGGLFLISIFVVGINVEQSIWDLYVPWVVVYPTRLYETVNF